MAYTNLIKLTRPGNLLIVCITMLVVRLFVVGDLIEETSIGMHYGLSWFYFFLLIMVAVMLTAAGNIINDYFDQKEDKINKPDKVIVGKTVKRRVAIILHQSLNIGAFITTLFLCFVTSYWWPILIPIGIATILWWYSPLLKKRAFIGNFSIALCTALVPIWSGIFEINELKKNYVDLFANSDKFFSELWIIVIAISLCAFLITLIREAQKDMEDLEGDKEGGYQTMPIRFGIAFTKNYVFSLLGIYIIGVLYFLFLLFRQENTNVLVDTTCAGMLLIPTIFSAVLTHQATKSKEFGKASWWTKWMMIAGLAAFCLISTIIG